MDRPQRRRSGNTNLASCVVATIFLAFLIATAVIVYFTVFKPRPPQVDIDAVKFPAFSFSNGAVNFTYSQQASVRNPNREAFTHYDSSLQLAYSGAQVGLIFIPAGRIAAGQTQYVLATFSVQSFPVTAVAPPLTESGAQTMEIVSRLRVGGRVRVLKVFTHRVESRISCSVVVEVTDGSVLGFHC